ncbi:uncharacterized protein [Clytia hemisphaerica]
MAAKPKSIYPSISKIGKDIFNIDDVNDKLSPYIVLVGNCGAGKSTIAEKLTDAKGRASSTRASFTITAEYLWTPDKSLLIADTPGLNSHENAYEYSLEVASAFIHKPLSKLFAVVEAHIRMNQVIDNIKTHVDKFIELPDELIGVIVTKMDIAKEWNESELAKILDEDLGIEDVVFSRLKTKGKDLQKAILKKCGTPQAFDLDGSSFLRLFKFGLEHRKVVRVKSRLVNRFRGFKLSFEQRRKNFDTEDQTDLFFEFKAFMEIQIDVIKKEMCKELDFTFMHDEAKNLKHAATLASMVNEIRAVLYDVRMEALKHQNDASGSYLRQCPHCKEIWTLVIGCDGKTTCGNRPLGKQESERNVMATFLFTPLVSDPSGKNIDLDIVKISEKQVLSSSGRKSSKSELKFLGCGKEIIWWEMKAVPMPSELAAHTKTHIKPSDINILPEGEASERVLAKITRQIEAKRVSK